jgi:hypothetical protein
MRLVVLALGLLVPQLSWAQRLSGGFIAGSYVLASSRLERMQGQIKLKSGSELIVKNEGGPNLTFTPYEVCSFRIGAQKYVTVDNFHVMAGVSKVEVDRAFVQQLDSGALVLTRYDFGVNSPATMNASGGMSGGGGWALSAFLLSGGTTPGITAAQTSPYSSGGKRFREAVRPYFAGRPDLQRMLDTKRINAHNLAAAVHAFNTNSPFSPSAALALD